MKKSLLIVALLISAASAAQATIYTIFSDNGILGTDLFKWGPSVSLSSVSVPAQGAPEGLYTMQAQGTGFDGWGVFYSGGINLSAFQNGELRFWLFTTTGDIEIDFEHNTGVATGNPNVDCFSGRKDC